MREQENLKLFPQPSDGTLTLYYYGEFDAMSADSDENKLAQVAPDLIIYSALTLVRITTSIRGPKSSSRSTCSFSLKSKNRRTIRN